MIIAAYRHVDAAFIAVWEGYTAKQREHVAMAEKYAAENDFDDENLSRIHALTRGVGSLPVADEK